MFKEKSQTSLELKHGVEKNHPAGANSFVKAIKCHVKLSAWVLLCSENDKQLNEGLWQIQGLLLHLTV